MQRNLQAAARGCNLITVRQNSIALGLRSFVQAAGEEVSHPLTFVPLFPIQFRGFKVLSLGTWEYMIDHLQSCRPLSGTTSQSY